MDEHLDVVWSTLDRLGVTVKLCRLPRAIDGEYVHERRLIRLKRGMASRLYRTTLAHECGHAVYGDLPTRFGPVHWKQERRAETWAALALIGLDGYRDAERRHDGNVEAMAVTLDVTTDLVEAYRRMLLRTDAAIYLAPRMGRGQWLAKSENLI